MDIDALRLSPSTGTETAKSHKVRRTIAPYLRGPISWVWLREAMILPGAALKVGLVLWHYRSLKKSLTFKVGTADIARFLGLSTATVRRAIDALQDVGLIGMECAPGRKCLVTMVEITAIVESETVTPATANREVSSQGDDPDPIDNSHSYWLQPEPGEDGEPDERQDCEESGGGRDDEVDIGPPPEEAGKT